MVLSMSRPWKHPTTHVYYYRRVVPEDLRALEGRREIRRSLGTKDPQAAKPRYAEIAAQVEKRWATLRKGVQTISHREAIAIAGEFYRHLVSENEENPGDEIILGYRLTMDGLAAGDSQIKVIATGSKETTDKMLARLKSRHRAAVERFLADEGLRVDDSSFASILDAVNIAMQQGRRQLLQYARGDYRPDPDAERFPSRSIEAPPRADEPMGDKYSLTAIYERYRTEAGHSPATVKKWLPIIENVAGEIPDIRSITPEWCVEWKDRLLAAGKAASSVNDGYLAALRSTCAWAKDNKLIAANPVEGVRARVAKKQQTRPKGFTDDEAKIILRATTVEPTQRLSEQHRAARRWLPWLCAYSGARVGEIGQLRGSDIHLLDEVWLIWITPEAGRTKTGHARYVAIHQHLLDQGFIEFVRGVGAGPLFYSPTRRRGGTPANPVHKKAGERIAAWVRTLGIDDPGIQPNHGWRHRFKTLSRRHDMDLGTRDYMQGHVPHNESEKYGDFEPQTLFREIMKLPAYDV